MIEIPLQLFLFIYVVFLGIFAFFFIVNLLHLVGTGTFTRPVMLLTAVLIVATLFVFEITGELLSTVDLSQPLTIDFTALGTSLTQGITK